MTRALLALGAVAGVIAWLLWASSRDLRETWTVPPMPDPDDDVQWDPWTRAMVSGLVADAERDRRIVAEWDATLPPLDDPTYLEAREVAIRSTQTGPIGPAA